MYLFLLLNLLLVFLDEHRNVKASAYCAINSQFITNSQPERKISILFVMFQEPSTDAYVGECDFIDSNMVKGLIGLSYLLLCLAFDIPCS